MNILNRLFNKEESVRPEDYGPIYVRWNEGSREYGPYDFAHVLTNNWSAPPLQARFGGDAKWSKYERIIRILERLTASEDQVAKLTENGALAPGAPPPLFKEALTQLDQLAKEEQDAKRAAKASLPATQHIRKKMDSLGITYPQSSTRAEANQLLKEHEEHESLEETAQQLRNHGVEISNELVRESMAQPELTKSLAGELEELSYLIEDLRELGVAPRASSLDSIDAIRQHKLKYQNILTEIDNIESELEEKELLIGEEEYRLMGSLPKRGMLAIKRAVVESSLEGTWNLDTCLLNLIAEHMPKVRVKKIVD